MDFIVFTNPQALYLLAIMLGLIVGSFLNVLVYRLPQILERQWGSDCAELLGIILTGPADRPISLSYPPSNCPQCRHAIRPWENIPVISYIFLGGRCSACSTPISLRYPFTESLCAILTLLAVAHFGPTWQAAAAVFLTWGLLALSLIDYDTQLLPDNITIPMLWMGLLASLAGIFTNPSAAIIGAATGYLSLWCVFHLFRLVTGKDGMGYGDFKLLAMLGAWLGWHSLPQIILLSSCVGAVIGIFMILVQGHDSNKPIPFGPYLAIAGWISLLWGEWINQLYLNWAGLI